jgi:hypothetical protein
MVAPAPTVSPGVLLMLFADLLVSPPGRVNIYGTVAVPCIPTSVRADDFAVRVLAAELWGLREDGALHFALTRRRLFFGDETRLVLSVGRSRASGLALAAELRAQVAHPHADADEREIVAVVMRWLGQQRDDPYRHVRVAVERDAMTAGLFVSPRADGASAEAAEPAPDCAVCARLRQAHADFPARWQRFLTDEPLVASALLAGCETALRLGRDPVVPRITGGS